MAKRAVVTRIPLSVAADPVGLSKAMYGEGGLKGMLLDFQRTEGARVVQEYERYMPRKVFRIMNRSRNKAFTGDKSSSVLHEWRFAQSFIFSADELRFDLVPVLHEIMIKVNAAARVQSGFYKRNFFFVQNDRLSTTLVRPRGGFGYGDIVGIANAADYAATLELRNKAWPKTMFNVFRAIYKKHKHKYDIRYRYLTGYEAVTKRAKGPVYVHMALPIIEVGALNSMAGNVGEQYGRRGRNRRKRRSRRWRGK